MGDSMPDSEASAVAEAASAATAHEPAGSCAGAGSGAGSGAGASGEGKRRRILIVGGVAGGASTAARLRRLAEDAEIIVLERGPHASFANCGLPYYVGGAIDSSKKLLVATQELFHDRFRIQVRVNTEVLSVDTEAQTLVVRQPDGSEVVEPYDACVLATGATALRLPIPGLDGPGVFSLRSIPDAKAIKKYILDGGATHVTIIGAGFIGLEAAHALTERGLSVTMVEVKPHVMDPMDREFAAPIEAELMKNGVEVICGDGVAEVVHPEAAGDGAASAGADAKPLTVRLASGKELRTSFVLAVAGARPESSLAVAAGLKVTERGKAIVVDDHMRTSAKNVWAVGDVVQSYRVLDHHGTVVPLAGIANRQGRVAAESIAGVPSARPMREVQGTAVVRAFGITIAMTGMMEKGLQRMPEEWPAGSYHVVQTHPGHHASYYPGAQPLHLKIAFAAKDGRVLGAQAVGPNHESVARRIDVISTAIQMGATVRDLAEAELCYAPQYGSAKDPVNVIGMLATNVLDGFIKLSDWDEVLASAKRVEAGEEPSVLVVDVRQPDEVAAGAVPGSVCRPLESLRTDKREWESGPVHVTCRVGHRAYVAVRLLRQRGVDAHLLSGGYQTYLMLQPRGAAEYRDVVEEYLRDLDKPMATPAL